MIIFSQENIDNKAFTENISAELSNLKKIKNILDKQKNIISKHYANKVSKLPSNPNQISELQDLVTSFNTAFEKNNASLQIANNLIQMLTSIDNIYSSNTYLIEEKVNSYNDFYNSNYPELIESIAFLTEFIQTLTNFGSDTTTNFKTQKNTETSLLKNASITDTEPTKKISINNTNFCNNQSKQLDIKPSAEVKTDITLEVEKFRMQNQAKQSEETKSSIKNNTTANPVFIQPVTPESEKKEIRKKLLAEIEKNNTNTTVESSSKQKSSTFIPFIVKKSLKELYNNNNNNNNDSDNSKDLDNVPINTKKCLSKDTLDLNSSENINTNHTPEENTTKTDNNSLSENTFATKITALPLQDNNTLRISEKDGSVYLPFKVSDLKQEFSTADETYNGIVDLVTTKYIVPITKYKNGVRSRFKEAYALVSQKEKKSPFKAFEVGIGVAFNRSLHPAIISACKSLDQLDSYLDALDKHDLSKFDSFNIEFDGLPFKDNNSSVKNKT